MQQVPSFTVALQCSRRRHTEGNELLTIDTGPSDLLFKDAEIRVVEKFFDHHISIDGNRNKREIAGEMKSANVIHFPGHASFSVDSPLDSALEFGLGNYVYAKDILSYFKIPNANLVVLSACETGLSKPNILDENDGFQSAFLYAGAKSLIVSLWKVDDLATLVLMDRFYQNLFDGLSISSSLHLAQAWIRGKADHLGEALSNGRELLEYVSRRRILDQVYDDNARSACQELLKYKVEECTGEPPFCEPVYWAAFVPIGCCWEGETDEVVQKWWSNSNADERTN